MINRKSLTANKETQMVRYLAPAQLTVMSSHIVANLVTDNRQPLCKLQLRNADERTAFQACCLDYQSCPSRQDKEEEEEERKSAPVCMKHACLSQLDQNKTRIPWINKKKIVPDRQFDYLEFSGDATF